MLALGLTLVVSVAATPPPVRAQEPLASTYDEASCDAGDGGECANEQLIEFDVPPAILDCQSPLIADMIGSCDLPTPAIPALHLPTLRNGGAGFSVARTGSHEHLTVMASAPALDAALCRRPPSLAPPVAADSIFALAATSAQDAPRPRLDRPPRA